MEEEITAKEAGQVKNLLKENLKLNQEIYEMVKGIKSFLFWQRIWGVIKIIIIVAPIIISIIYLPPLLKQIKEQYQSLLGVGQSNLQLDNLLNNEGLDVKSLLNYYKSGEIK